jgi:hypothetical protein
MIEDAALSLQNMFEGAAIEMFDRQLARVYNNIGDINTDLNAREITLKVKFTPAKDRSYVVINITCPPAKLSGQETIETSADLRLDERGRYFARERVLSQIGFQFKFGGNVAEMKKSVVKGGTEDDSRSD